MIHIKSPDEIEKMKISGAMLAKVLKKTLAMAKPGVSELDLDRFAEKEIRELGGEPGFQKVPGYKYTICISTNDVVVHGIPTDYILQEGDVVGIDCGVHYQGFHTDMAETIQVKSEKLKMKNDETTKFLETGKQALYEAIRQTKEGNRVGHISKTIQSIVEGSGYAVVRNLVGHGVGRELHEEPEVPGVLSQSIGKTPLLKEGMTIAIEVIYNKGGREVVYKGDDGWSIATKDGSISGVFERTILITKSEPVILTA